MTEPDLDFRTNAQGTFNVLSEAKKFGVKVIYASSASVYGNARHLPICEDDQVNILNPYAASKLSGEAYCMAFHESYGLPVVILRYSNVYGPYQSPDNPYCGVVSKFFNAVKNKQPIQIHGNGEQTRDFTYVDDVVEATLLAALSERAVGQVFNIGTGFETSVNQLVSYVRQSAIKSINIDQNFKIKYIDRRDIDNITRRVLNIEKARKILRWVPAVTLQEGLRKTYEWLLRVGE